MMTRTSECSVLITRAAFLGALILAPAITRAGVAEQKLLWEQRFGPFEELVQAHQLPEPNDTAKTLEGFGPALGLDLVPYSRGKGVPGAAKRPSAKSLDTRPAEWAAWFTGEIRRQEDVPAPIPPSVLAWHAAHQDTLEQVRHVLLTWKAPRWEEDMLDAAKDPLPNLVALNHLTKILSGDALVAESLGDPLRADADLEAAWNIGVSLTDRAESISVFVGFSQARMAAVLVRKLSRPSDAWVARLESGSFRAAMLVGLRVEARYIAGAAEERWGWGFEELDAGPVRRWILRHGVGLVAAKSLRDLLPIAEELAAPPRCDHPAGASSGRKAAWFEDFFPDLMAAFTDVPRRLDALGLQFELTRRVLALRKAAAESGAFPAGLPGGSAVTDCPDHAWRWKTDGLTGHLEPIRLGAEGVGKWWAQGNAQPLPMECTLSLR